MKNAFGVSNGLGLIDEREIIAEFVLCKFGAHLHAEIVRTPQRRV
jgi:hypothetical protein